jgi:hypothetical protein
MAIGPVDPRPTPFNPDVEIVTAAHATGAIHRQAVRFFATMVDPTDMSKSFTGAVNWAIGLNKLTQGEGQIMLKWLAIVNEAEAAGATSLNANQLQDLQTILGEIEDQDAVSPLALGAASLWRAHVADGPIHGKDPTRIFWNWKADALGLILTEDPLVAGAFSFLL